MCKYNNCDATTNKAEYNTSDAIMFQNRFLEPFPKYRFSFQKWWLQCHESPLNEPNYKQFNGLFNATTNYASNSDLPIPFGSNYVERIHPLNDSHRRDYTKGRTKPVAWFNSNCNDHSNRKQYAKHLQKYIPVDIYGACGKLKCHKAGSNTHCDTMLKKQYKFYLAFENSICVDYVTEKIWRAIDNDVVPVVLGGANYSKILPPNSYIDIKDYKSPKELAAYLNMLHKDDAKYNTLFDWKLKYTFQSTLESYPCRICEYMNKYGHVTKVYDKIDVYWSKSNCTTAQKFYKNVDKRSWTW